MKISDAVNLIRGVMPTDSYIEQIKTSSGTPESHFEERFVELNVSISESQITRDQALNKFNILRLKLYNICEASFKEEKDMEWIYYLKFKWNVESLKQDAI